MPNIIHSIQDYCQKINSRISLFDLGVVFVIAISVCSFSVYLYSIKQKRTPSVTYTVSKTNESQKEIISSKPFASSKGKTYTFSWCRNSDSIAQKNKIYFASAEEAKQSGRTLSKFCSQ